MWWAEVLEAACSSYVTFSRSQGKYRDSHTSGVSPFTRENNLPYRPHCPAVRSSVSLSRVAAGLKIYDSRDVRIPSPWLHIIVINRQNRSSVPPFRGSGHAGPSPLATSQSSHVRQGVPRVWTITVRATKRHVATLQTMAPTGPWLMRLEVLSCTAKTCSTVVGGIAQKSGRNILTAPLHSDRILSGRGCQDLTG